MTSSIESLRDQVDRLSRLYLTAQIGVICERSGEIQAETLEMLDRVNAERAAAGLEPLPRPEHIFWPGWDDPD